MVGFKKRSDAQQSLREKGIFEPKDEKELKVYLKDKRIIGINNLGKSFSDFKRVNSFLCKCNSS